MSRNDEYRELFLAEAEEQCSELNRLFTLLEKDVNNAQSIDAIFRITHTLKGNAMGLGFDDIAALSHVMEDVFNALKQKRISIDTAFFDALYRANDTLCQLIASLRTGETVRYKGIKTKLEVALRNALQQSENETAANDNAQSPEHTADELLQTDAGEEEELNHELSVSDVVQVPVRKLDNLLNIIGELIIERDTLIARNTAKGNAQSEMVRLQRITSDLQYAVMDVRLVQIGFLFSKFHRVLRDAASVEQKKAELITEGTEIEIDRSILRILSDSLVHLIRNAAAHGIETPAERLAALKPETGTVKLAARSEKENVIIEVTDDGKGIHAPVIRSKAIEKGLLTAERAALLSDEDIIYLIFEPGFSSADSINSIAGRGVGMDVVKRAAESVGGKINLRTLPGSGTTFELILPSTMAVKGAMIFEVRNQPFAIALSNTEAVISYNRQQIHRTTSGLIADYLGKTIALFFLSDIFYGKQNGQIASGADTFETSSETEFDVIIVSSSTSTVGFVVDRLLQQKEIVEKTLSEPLNHHPLFSGATILGTGDVCLVLNVPGILSGLWKERFIESLHY
jgi:two-component system, chemotaxis family, sensor kinase CheA